MFYAKLANDPTFWLVKDGKRTIVESQEQMHAFGFLPVRVVSQEELDGIPFADAPDPDILEELAESFMEDE